MFFDFYLDYTNKFEVNTYLKSKMFSINEVWALWTEVKTTTEVPTFLFFLYVNFIIETAGIFISHRYTWVFDYVKHLITFSFNACPFPVDVIL